MAKVTISVADVTTTYDLQRFLNLLDDVGIDVASGHPVRITMSGEISASTSASFLTLSGDELADDLDQES